MQTASQWQEARSFRPLETTDGSPLDISEGEFVAIVPSGCGKAALPSFVTSALETNDGLSDLGRREHRVGGRGVASQTDSLMPGLTVRENLSLAIERAFPEKGAAEVKAHAQRYVEMLNVTQALGRQPDELGPGMHQRVTLACALAKEPRIVLLDEPLEAIEPLTRAILQADIEDIWAREHQTIVLITASIDEAVLLADRVVPLESGRTTTLRASFPIDLPRPRSRQARSGTVSFRCVRNDVARYLDGPRVGTAPDRRGA